MLAYAMMLSAKRAFGLRVFLEDHVLQNLRYYFQDVFDVPSLDTICQEQVSWEQLICKVTIPHFNVSF
jgi:hypothetical protein